MANAKQDGSNLINIEYSTGRCATQCEQCFVNFGQQGTATCKGNANPGHEKLVAWLDQQPDYTPMPRFKKGTLPRGREWLLREITKAGKGFWNIPTIGARDAWVVKGSKKKSYDVVTGVEHLGPMPFFLRVSSMSDSSYAPLEWIDAVLDAWGDQCFFNSAIRSIKKTKGSRLDHFNKLVVTLNPGKQTLSDFRPATTRAKTGAGRTTDRNDWAKMLAKTGQDSPYEHMGTATEKAADFLHPLTLTKAGFRQYEDLIKFYRLRAIPTVRGHFETDKPVVITQMRFVSLEHALEFCRRYELHYELRMPPKLFKANGDPLASVIAPWAERQFKISQHIVKDTEAAGRELYIWSDKNDPRNASPYSGEASSFIFEGSYYRTQDTDGFNADPYVCDRMHGGCSHCGLCASLDGAGPTIDGVEFCNPLNELKGHLLAPFPGPTGAGYLGFLRHEHLETSGQGAKKKTKLVEAGMDLFASNLQKLGVEADVPLTLRGWAANPQDPADLDDALLLLQSSADYLQKTDGPYFCEGWNTHENVETSVAFAVYSIMSYAKDQGWSFFRANDLVTEVADSASPDFDVLEGIDGLDETLWDGVSPWNDVFGDVE